LVAFVAGEFVGEGGHAFFAVVVLVAVGNQVGDVFVGESGLRSLGAEVFDLQFAADLGRAFSVGAVAADAVLRPVVSGVGGGERGGRDGGDKQGQEKTSFCAVHDKERLEAVLGFRVHTVRAEIVSMAGGQVGVLGVAVLECADQMLALTDDRGEGH
jgi:hypothetical protein